MPRAPHVSDHPQYNPRGYDTVSDYLELYTDAVMHLEGGMQRLATGEISGYGNVMEFAQRAIEGANAILSPDLEHAPSKAWDPYAVDLFTGLTSGQSSQRPTSSFSEPTRASPPAFTPTRFRAQHEEVDGDTLEELLTSSDETVMFLADFFRRLAAGKMIGSVEIRKFAADLVRGANAIMARSFADAPNNAWNSAAFSLIPSLRDGRGQAASEPLPEPVRPLTPLEDMVAFWCSMQRIWLNGFLSKKQP